MKRLLIAPLLFVGCTNDYYTLSQMGNQYRCEHVRHTQSFAPVVETLAICDTAAECKAVCDAERDLTRFPPRAKEKSDE